MGSVPILPSTGTSSIRAAAYRSLAVGVLGADVGGEVGVLRSQGQGERRENSSSEVNSLTVFGPGTPPWEATAASIDHDVVAVGEAQAGLVDLDGRTAFGLGLVDGVSVARRRSLVATRATMAVTAIVGCRSAPTGPCGAMRRRCST